jgi:hypothetical protein
MIDIPTEEELAKLLTLVKERFVGRMRKIYGDTDELEQWAESLDLLDSHAGEEAKAFSRAALTQLIRTKYPDYATP